jgi:siroheme synthase (precorrin-2 oxidase/ferrochelatase)
MTWMQRLKRVFNIDIEICEKCKGPVKIIACVEDPAVIGKILKHLREMAIPNNTAQSPPGRGPPQVELFERS